MDAFYRVLAAKAPNIHVPYIVILVSDEAETYRPEMEWIAKELRNRGRRVHVFHPDVVMPLGDSICVGIDGDPQLWMWSIVSGNCLIYRMFRLLVFAWAVWIGKYQGW